MARTAAPSQSLATRGATARARRGGSSSGSAIERRLSARARGEVCVPVALCKRREHLPVTTDEDGEQRTCAAYNTDYTRPAGLGCSCMRHHAPLITHLPSLSLASVFQAAAGRAWSRTRPPRAYYHRSGPRLAQAASSSFKQALEGHEAEAGGHRPSSSVSPCVTSVLLV